MATSETLLALVQSGSNVTLVRGFPREALLELAAAAKASGATLTIHTSYPSDFLIALANQFGKTVAFIDGLADFKKE